MAYLHQISIDTSILLFKIDFNLSLCIKNFNFQLDFFELSIFLNILSKIKETFIIFIMMNSILI